MSGRESKPDAEALATEFRPIRGRVARVVLLWLGHLSVGTGLVALLVPVVPTVPFLLLATACYARSSRRFHSWLVNHKVMGPPIRDWYTHRSLFLRQKIVIALSIVAGCAGSCIFVLPAGWPRWTAMGLASIPLLFILRIPTRQA